MNRFVDDIRRRVSALPRARVLFPEADDVRVVEAALQLKKEGVVEPIFVGGARAGSRTGDNAVERMGVTEAEAVELETLLITLRAHKVGTPDELTGERARALARDPLVCGMYLVRMRRADALIAGAVRLTRDVLRAALWLLGTAPGIKTISSSFYMVVPAFRGEDEVLTFADCGVVPEPTAAQLADIAVAAAEARKFIVGDEARVALLSYSTRRSGGNGVSIARVREAIQILRDKHPTVCVAHDELQADAALVASIAERKAPGDMVAGKANVLIFPSLDAANIAYKLVERLVPGARALGPILHGLPSTAVVHDLSRGASVEDIVLSSYIAALRSKAR